MDKVARELALTLSRFKLGYCTWCALYVCTVYVCVVVYFSFTQKLCAFLPLHNHNGKGEDRERVSMLMCMRMFQVHKRRTDLLSNGGVTYYADEISNTSRGKKIDE